MLAYADVLSTSALLLRASMLTFADVCRRMPTYADVCWRMLLRTVPGPKDDKQRLALKRLQEVGVGVTCCPQHEKKNCSPPDCHRSRHKKCFCTS
jgi:hypothetical protein